MWTQSESVIAPVLSDKQMHDQIRPIQPKEYIEVETLANNVPNANKAYQLCAGGFQKTRHSTFLVTPEHLSCL
uniref:AlNc14C3G445 protein n=1 Tax=Albugo laibachii Nc14 TaxID=890382 RepID=F0VZW7_9STRA|nr:AlNc14C3G445 [Albugo laibachii Nc14]|eukprot:CCA14338.1 AlNc14C3G445 [Albugo laibachii Nc14]